MGLLELTQSFEEHISPGFFPVTFPRLVVIFIGSKALLTANNNVIATRGTQR
jgi:hypothetical protein